jgi:hypothetical protein
MSTAILSVHDQVESPAGAQRAGRIAFVPRYFAPDQPGSDLFELEKVFENPSPGGNFSFGLGLGVAILMEKTSDGVLTIPADLMAGLCIDAVEVDFVGKSRIETVKV